MITSELTPKLDELLSLHRVLKGSISEARTRLDSLKREEARLQCLVELNSKAHVVVLSLIDRLNDAGLGALDILLTDALTQVFPNRSYTVTHEVTEERGYNNLNFYLKETLDDGHIQSSNIRNATGGSVRSTLGLVSTAFYLMKTNSLPFLASDEAFSQISDEHVESFFTLLRSFCVEAGFSFLMVTHDSRFIPYLDNVYRVVKGGTVVKEK